jgi:hypothetical protein
MASFAASTGHSGTDTEETKVAESDEIHRAIEDVGSVGLLQQLNGVTSDELLVLSDPARFPFITENELRRIQSALRRRRIDLTFSSLPNKTCVVVTAPHTLKLCRDNHDPHSSESYTKFLAQRLAELSGGACITWKKSEIERVVKMTKSNGGEPPLSNRDPNYLTNQELPSSPWFHYLVQAKQSLMLATSRNLRESLHLDVHGMKDSTIEGVDCIFGTLAMEKQLQKQGDDSSRVEELRVQLMESVQPVLDHITATLASKETTAENSSAAPFIASATHDRLTGWAGMGRNTLTQMSSCTELFRKLKDGDDDMLFHSAFQTSIQIELSHRLRKHLFGNKMHCSMFLVAIVRGAGMA